jgi:hypothetical protein
MMPHSLVAEPLIAGVVPQQLSPCPKEVKAEPREVDVLCANVSLFPLHRDNSRSH